MIFTDFHLFALLAIRFEVRPRFVTTFVLLIRVGVREEYTAEETATHHWLCFHVLAHAGGGKKLETRV